MEASFYQANRKALLDFLPDNSAAVLFSGHAPRQSADAYYPFFCSRNFLYLTGVDFEGFVLYMFSIIKPGMPMASVDQTARKYCFEQLKAIGKLQSYDEIGKYMWHGGAHHVGFDVHDDVDMTHPVAPGMVFCVDIGIYDEDSGIGFRLEDNCLVTENGCENLSASIPRKLEDIEAAMAK
ncbi:MAG TPA: aminopeptidase P N-terminal domain-containing protein [Candidatus Caccousia avicola]|uniref:Xaa-Pro aminopeptidase n=1 Tax=Candidatus Caccousia avicola TaxID=2840721 RepID=A0A9D1AM13_9FIRM|nr:aminopeptidase P N-terminal domain-containing protein [Candidatus Caccousia avicola]